MKQLVMAAMLAAGWMATALAADPSPAQKAQQGRMAQCNKDAEGQTGDARKAFMKDCLSTKKAPTQKDKMKTCNVDAKGKSGDERKAFMKDCLSAKPA